MNVVLRKTHYNFHRCLTSTVDYYRETPQGMVDMYIIQGASYTNKNSVAMYRVLNITCTSLLFTNLNELRSSLYTRA